MVIPSFKVSDNVNSDIIYVVVKFIESTNSNINEVIRTVLNSLFIFFLRKDFARTKSTKKHQRAPKRTKSTKSTKSTKTQPNKSTKTQISEQKQKMRLFVLAKKKNRSLYNGNAGPTKLVKVLSALHEQKLVY